MVAEQLGVEIIEQLTAAPSTPTSAANTVTDVQTAVPQEGSSVAERQRIREHILAQLPEGSVTETLLAQLIERYSKNSARRSSQRLHQIAAPSRAFAQ